MSAREAGAMSLLLAATPRRVLPIIVARHGGTLHMTTTALKFVSVRRRP
jgi:hypothetical protein